MSQVAIKCIEFLASCHLCLLYSQNWLS